MSLLRTLRCIAVTLLLAMAITSAHASSAGMTEAVFERSNKIFIKISEVIAANPALSEEEVSRLNWLEGLAAVGAREPRPSDAYPHVTPDRGFR